MATSNGNWWNDDSSTHEVDRALEENRAHEEDRALEEDRMQQALRASLLDTQPTQGRIYLRKLNILFELLSM